ncbi:MAG: TMEM175 family protein [Candidatus Aminicenantes bacterium]|jgi:uncharacterized membrane protein
MNKFGDYSVTDLPSTKRLESLTDGVFAVSLTFLTLGLVLLEAFGSFGGMDLTQILSQIWPGLIIYGISFLVLGVFWILHQKQFQIILGYDGILLWINILFLMFVALVPFSTFLLYNHYDEWIAKIFYGTNQIAICQLLFINWCYASHRHRLIKSDISSHQCKIPMILFQFISLGFLGAIVISSINPLLAVILFVLTLVITIVLSASRHRILYQDQREIEE